MNSYKWDTKGKTKLNFLTSGDYYMQTGSDVLRRIVNVENSSLRSQIVETGTCEKIQNKEEYVVRVG